MFETTERWRTAQEAEKEWWKKYKGQEKPQVDLKVRHYEKAIAMMAGIEEFKENDIALDVGCGPGDFISLIPSGLKIGLDPLVPYYAKHGFCNRTFQAVQAISENIPFRPEACTKVFCYNVLDHVVDTKKTLAEIRNVARTGGYLLFALDVNSTITKFRRVVSERVGFKRDPYHPHSFTSKDVRKMLSRSGFQLIKIEVLFSEKSPNGMIRLIESVFGMVSHYYLCAIVKKIPERETTSEIA